jgi:hypothetical protein
VPGEGAEFYFDLPFHDAATRHPQPAAAAPAAKSLRGGKNPLV